ncbi:MAG: DNA polymerase Y family protein [Deltaproteobacteria bacterium]|nr:DNA polymerase Y family protein [Deltaproteobacteria bacterium]
MDRLACVDVPALPLQLLLARHPDWKRHPAVVVERDQPQGKILWTNERARRRHIRSGMRYAAGLALAKDLQAGTVPESDIAEGIARITAELRGFSPKIEPSDRQPGVFWLDASGLGRLYPSLTDWAQRIQRRLNRSAVYGRVVIGFTRFGTYAVARAGGHSVQLFEHPEHERCAALQVALECLDLSPPLRDRLERLGIRNVEAFLALPPGGVRRRFGAETFRLYEFARGSLWTPLRPQAEPVVHRHPIQFEPAEADVHRLLFRAKPPLCELLDGLASRGEALTELELHLTLDRGPRHVEHIRTAAPTRDERQILNLVHLRLEDAALGAGVTELELVLHSVRENQEQLALFTHEVPRDLHAGNRALARLRAEFGEDSVVHAQLAEAHLPEASFRWEPLEHLTRPNPRNNTLRPLVRRLFARPQHLPPRPRRESDSWLLLGERGGAATHRGGPYVVSGGWWVALVHREYHFVELQSGELCWVYYDRRRQKWLLHGQVG